MRDSLRHLLVPILIGVAALPMLGCGGCSFNSFDKPVRFYPSLHGGTEVVEAVPWSDSYRVVVQPEIGKVRAWTPTRIDAQRGDKLGFREKDGTIYALIGNHEQVLGTLPPGIVYVAWGTRERRMGTTRAPIDGTLGVLAFTGQVIFVAGLGVGLVALALFGNNDDDCEDRW